MMRAIFCACLVFLAVENLVVSSPVEASKFDGLNVDCETCDGKIVDKPVCGEDSNTYMTLCHLQEAECILKKIIGFACNGKCPCDPEELYQLDEDTVLALSSLRKQVQLEDYAKENSMGTMEAKTKPFSFEILDKKDDETDGEDETASIPTKKPITVKMNIKQMLNVNTTKAVKRIKKQPKLKPTSLCPLIEMRNLPNRLVDWFHVLKTNERRKVFLEMNAPNKAVLTEMSFIEAKLKSLYSQLACSLQEDDGQEICFTSVKWMFEHLDANEDMSLSDDELSEIEEINSEHCIKPFLQHCDSNGDGEVRLKEFCKCLCVEPPCTKMMRVVPTNITDDGKPVAATNHTFAPKCDEDGFFMPTQCHNDECWCVDRNGAEYIGTRTSSKVPSCEDNTQFHELNLKTKPLDYKKENSRPQKK